MFSGEEMYGKYLDLLLCYERYVNLRDVRRLDYLQYLGEFDNFAAIPPPTKLSHAYARYLDGLHDYFQDYFARAKPLFDLKPVVEACTALFEEHWAAGQVPGWEEAAQREAAVDPAQGIFCGPCQKLFTNRSVYQAHLAGRKHLRAAATVAGDANSRTEPQAAEKTMSMSMSTAKRLALREALISRYAEILGQVREATRTNVERKQSRTPEEREQDVLAEEGEGEAGDDGGLMARGPGGDGEAEEEEDDDDDEEDGAIYNPKNLPLDWDGKPIPYWLWKLHGLGVRYPCEICGNHVYMGRRAFDQHFFVLSIPAAIRPCLIPLHLDVGVAPQPCHEGPRDPEHPALLPNHYDGRGPGS